MQIVKAREQHVWGFIRLVEDFLAQGVDAHDFGFNKQHTEKTFCLWVRSQIAYLLMDDTEVVGILAGVIAPHFFDYATTYFHEAMWYVKPGNQSRGWGIRLFYRVECECKVRGVSKMIMAHTHAHKPEQFEKLYSRLGFKKLETHYVKDL